MSGPTCMECGQAHADLVTGEVIYPHRPDLYQKSFYRCDNCGAYCGCHPGTTTPLGQPCGPLTRAARSRAHAAFDPIWKGKKMSRSSAYKWLAEAVGIQPARCHIGMMTAEQADRVVAACRAHAHQPLSTIQEGHNHGKRPHA